MSSMLLGVVADATLPRNRFQPTYGN